jgi:hypothetical protein
MTPHDPADVFGDIARWSTATSGQAQLTPASDVGVNGQPALRLEFDFKGGGGFVVASCPIARAMPDAWALTLQVRGAAPANKLEIKFVDPSGRNVWWWRREAFEFPLSWEMLRIRSSEVSFAWGPAGGGPIQQLGTLEIALVAGPGGTGSVWFSELCFEDLSLHEPPRVLASSAQPGHEPEEAITASASTGWRSAASDACPWFALDFGREHEYGGLVIDWDRFAARRFEVQCSNDGSTWKTLTGATQAEGERSYIYLAGGGRSRHLRLVLREPPTSGGAIGIRKLDVRPFDFSRSLADFFHAIAACEPRGHHPRWLHREQSYWTPVGVPGGTTAAILNEEGLFEPDRASFSLEPFLYADAGLITWADCEVSVSLENRALPIPSSTWSRGDLTLTTTAYAALASARAQARARYRIINHGRATRRLRLFVAMRPLQVSPPWQSFREIGGASEIRSLAWRDGAVWVNGATPVVPHTAPSAVGFAAFEQGGVMRHVAQGVPPPHAEIADDFGYASGTLCWDLEVPPAAAREVELAVPFTERPSLGRVSIAPSAVAELANFDGVTRHWARELGGVRIRVGGKEPACIEAVRTATGHILASRDGAALQPGPRRYTRSWIRDGATMSAALLRMGCADAVRDFLAWYAGHQAADGNVPCAVDRDGVDWLPEHDSHGQFVFTLCEYFRFSADRELTAALWPAAQRAISYLESLLEGRRTPEFRTPERRVFFGILPESVSHEGYLAQPVHAYWDDFWAWRGISDGAELARSLGDSSEATRLAALREELGACLYASIDATIATRGLAYVPGSVEWADFDASATATAVAISDADQRLPRGALAWTFDEYLRGLRSRRDGRIAWNKYSAYEIRILGAMVRLGRRADAHELLEFFLADRRPRTWNQWPEVSWRNPREAGHLGDVPHAWIGAEYVLAVLGMFAYERVSDAALVIAAGISDAWLDAGEVVVENLPTWWGPLRYSIRREGPDALYLRLDPGLAMPPGGIIVQPPLARPLAGVELDGGVLTEFESDQVRIRQTPAHFVMRF